jgi:hypothetical protein
MGYRDERDVSEPREKSWQEFRASFAAALLHAWLVKELDELAPDYFDDLLCWFNNQNGVRPHRPARRRARADAGAAQALAQDAYYLSPGWLRIDPTFAPLKGNPRFERLVAGK